MHVCICDVMLLVNNVISIWYGKQRQKKLYTVWVFYWIQIFPCFISVLFCVVYVYNVVGAGKAAEFITVQCTFVFFLKKTDQEFVSTCLPLPWGENPQSSSVFVLFAVTKEIKTDILLLGQRFAPTVCGVQGDKNIFVPWSVNRSCHGSTLTTTQWVCPQQSC